MDMRAFCCIFLNVVLLLLVNPSPLAHGTDVSALREPLARSAHHGSDARRRGPSVYAPYYVQRFPKHNSTKNETHCSATLHSTVLRDPSTYWDCPSKAVMAAADLKTCQQAIDWIGKGGQAIDEFWLNPNQAGLSPRCFSLWRSIPTLYQYMNARGGGSSIFGQDLYASRPQLGSLDVAFTNFILLSEPRMNRFAEIGTGSGVSSVYLATSARMRLGILTTVDTADNRAEAAKLVWNDSYMHRLYAPYAVSATQGECRPLYCEPISSDTKGVIAKSDIWLVNNSTNVNQVILLYADHAPVGSIALIHGMTMDRRQRDRHDALFRMYGYQPVYREFAESMGTHLRAWKRALERAPELTPVKL